MVFIWQTIVGAAAVLSSALLLVREYNKGHRWYLRQDEQDQELRAIRRENTMLTYGVLACLKGLREQGCNGPVSVAIEKIEKDLNLRAHGQGGGET